MRQVFADEAGYYLGRSFRNYLDALTPGEVDRRKIQFERGETTPVHRDKFLTYEAGLQELEHLGLAAPIWSQNDAWTNIETTTAAEFMAALAMALCRAGIHVEGDRSTTWVPTTDRQGAVNALLSGLIPTPNADRENLRVVRRIRGEMRASDVRADLLDRLLPVPDEVVPIDRLVRFRARHGRLLPALRRFLEEKIDAALAMTDEELSLRMLDRLADEVEDQVKDAETYLRESGFRAVSRSSLLRVCRFIPGAGDYIGKAQDLAGALQTNPDFETRSLAYLAFARATFPPYQRFELDPWTGQSLIDSLRDVS